MLSKYPERTKFNGGLVDALEKKPIKKGLG
jgi:hypothetical protein